MTSLSLPVLLIIKPLLIVGLGGLQYLGLQSFSATTRHFNLWVVLMLLPLSVLLGLMIDAPIWIDLPQDHWLLAVNLQAYAWPLLAVYVFGVCWGVLYLALGLWELRGLRVDTTMAGYDTIQREIDQLRELAEVKAPVRLVLSETDDAVASWGWRVAKIQLPITALDWPIAQRQLILLHELGHVARRDWTLLLMSKTIVMLFWFLPPVWLLQKLMIEMSERACDDWVLNVDGRDSEYAALLLALETQASDLPVAQLWQHSNFLRINAVLERYSDHDTEVAPTEWGKVMVLAALVLAPLTAVGFRGAELDTVITNASRLYFVPSSQAQPSVVASPWLVPNVDIQKPDRTAVLEIPNDRPMEHINVSAYALASAHSLPAINRASLKTVNMTALTSTSVEPTVRVKGFLPIIMVTPIYPRKALARNIEGRIMVQFTVTTTGEPVDPTIIFAQPKGVFEKNVLRALSQSRFRPLTINGVAVDVKGVSEEFVFKLIDHHTEPPPHSDAPPAVTSIALSH